MTMKEKLEGFSHLLVTLFLREFASLMAMPAVTDVTMEALCPGLSECSLAIYLSGFQQAITGLGTVLAMPVVGNMSDKYGRKTLLTIPMTLAIFPLAIMAYNRSKNFYYAYYALRTLTDMFGFRTVQFLSLAYVADNVSEEKRTSAFGILLGVESAAFVGGTLAARFLSPAQAFQGATVLSMVATVYMRIFLKESISNNDGLKEPILAGGQTNIDKSEGEFSKSSEARVSRKIPSPIDLMRLLNRSTTISLAAFVSFFCSIAESGIHSSLLYYLKAQFGYKKDQFADLMLVCGIGGALSQLFIMPLLAPIIREEKLLSIGLGAGVLYVVLDSIAWAAWVSFIVLVVWYISAIYIAISFLIMVPYVAAVFSMLALVGIPSLLSIISKQAGSREQGTVQGCISSIGCFATVISPLVYSPLTALFLSERAPFHFPGFSIMCAGVAQMMGFVCSIMMMMTTTHVLSVSNNKLTRGDSSEA